VVATVVQNPYRYGYESINVLNALHKGDKSVIPASKFLDIPARVIDKSNVESFSKEINERLGKK
jgi:ribose transport system substrate-binding protein